MAKNMLNVPSPDDAVEFDKDFGQKFIVTVDAEEEFDWSAPLQRSEHGIRSVPAMRKFQQFCEGFGVVPIYLVDYPIAISKMAAETLKLAVLEDRAEVGVQLHPWVNPPFTEDVNEFNSYAGNLPAELEGDKFRQLREEIERNFEMAPMIYRAGRYGIGPATAEILRENGIAIDTSVRANFDYSHAGGPNYRNHPLKPYWIDKEHQLLELPVTTIFWGPLRQLGGWIYPHLWRAPSLRGLLAKAGLLERIALTPEGITAAEAIRAIDIAIDDGLPVLVFSFHSPSLAPGHTPYVHTDADLDSFYDWWREIFTYLASRNIKPSCVRDIMSSVRLA